MEGNSRDSYNPPAATTVPSTLRLPKISACGDMREIPYQHPEAQEDLTGTGSNPCIDLFLPQLSIFLSTVSFLPQVLRRIIWIYCLCIVSQEKSLCFTLHFSFFFSTITQTRDRRMNKREHSPPLPYRQANWEAGPLPSFLHHCQCGVFSVGFPGRPCCLLRNQMVHFSNQVAPPL